MQLQVYFKGTGYEPGVWVMHDTGPRGWRVQARMEVQRGRVVIATLRIAPLDKLARGGIAQHVVRQIPFSSFAPFCVTSLRELQRDRRLAPMVAGVVSAFLPTIGPLVTERPRPRGAGGRDDYFYAAVARDYVDAIRRGSRRPVQDLAATRDVSPAKARDMVREARERGLMPFSKSGVRGGVLSPRALTLLKQKRSPQR